MLTGFEPSNMQDRCWLQQNTKELNFESTLTRSHPVDKTARTEVTSWGTAGNSLAGPLHARGKEIPERTGYLERVASLKSITFSVQAVFLARDYRRVSGNRFPSNRLQNASRVPGG